MNVTATVGVLVTSGLTHDGTRRMLRVVTLKEIGTRMAKARKAAGLSQEELAVKMGVRVRTVQRWESGDNAAQITSLSSYAELTGVTLAWLIGAVGGDEPQLSTDAVEALRDQWRRNEEALERLERLVRGGNGRSETA